MEENDKPQIKLDGSYGTGVVAEVTIYTKQGEDREKEETFLFPYNLINFENLTVFDKVNLIKGYKIIKQEKPSALKDLGL